MKKWRIRCLLLGLISGTVLTLATGELQTIQQDPVCQWATATIDYMNRQKEVRPSTGKSFMHGKKESRDNG